MKRNEDQISSNCDIQKGAYTYLSDPHLWHLHVEAVLYLDTNFNVVICLQQDGYKNNHLALYERHINTTDTLLCVIRTQLNYTQPKIWWSQLGLASQMQRVNVKTSLKHKLYYLHLHIFIHWYTDIHAINTGLKKWHC